MKKLILTISLLATACTERPPASSVLEKSTCALPCWNDIVPGQTTEADVLQILQASALVDQDSIQNMHQAWNIFDNQVVFFLRKDRATNQKTRIRGYVDLTKGVVSGLTLCGEINTSMGDIVEAAGEPEGILSGATMGQEGRLVILIDSQKGMSYWYTAHKTRSNPRYEITPDVPVDCIYTFDPALYDELLDAGLLSGSYLDKEETLKVMYPWNGYGVLDEKYPARRP